MSGAFEGIGLALLIVVPAFGCVLSATAGDDRWSVFFGWLMIGCGFFALLIAFGLST